MGKEFLFEMIKKKNSKNGYRQQCYNVVNALNATEVHPNNIKMGNFILRVFYLNEKECKISAPLSIL